MKAPYRTAHRLPVWLLLLLGIATLHPTDAAELATLHDGAAQTISLARQWADRAFARATVTDAQSAAAPLPCSWTVTHKSHQVLADTTVWKTPITLGDEVFPHGIYMDAPAAVCVRLTVPAVAFTAIVGIDNNSDTQRMPDAGSARFHIVVEGERLFSTPVLHLRDKAIRITMPLSGVTEFTLETDDGGNGRGWDQCAWANAAVELADHAVIFLDSKTLNDSLPNRSNVPFSFTYGGRPSAELLPHWKYSQTTESLDGSEQRTASYLDPKTGLLIECQVTTYSDSSGIDWVCWLSNTGSQDTPVIEQFLPLHVDNLLPDLSPELPMTLRWSNGDGCTDQSFLPHDELLEVGQHRQFTARSSDTTCFPFFNLHSPGGGWILAIGWTGTWTAEFGRGSSGEVSLQAGMANTHFSLRPGERVRSPRILLYRYLGDNLIDGHNGFRRLMLAHYVQWRDGKPAEPPIAYNGASGLYVRAQRDGQPLGRLTEQTELSTIETIAQLGCEAYWLDAYWYPQPWHENLGNWYSRGEDFPRGLRPLSDATHRHGMQFVLWFAPHLVSPHTQWTREYPQHIHGGGEERGGTLKLGDRATQDFVIDWLSTYIRQWNIDIYREDLGIGEAPQEGPDRVGIAEMKHVNGFYRIWSELLKQYPHLLIDNCCGGGRRIDLEANCRAFTLWRSDYNDIGQGLQGPGNFAHMATADQVMVTGLSLYIPFHTGPVWNVRPYCFRSAMSAGIALYNDLDAWTLDSDMTRQAIAELKRVRPLYQGDIYPLFPLTTSPSDWHALQLHRPDLRRGCVLVFRRPAAAEAKRQLPLHRIDPQARYLVSIQGETYTQPPATEMMGSELQQLQVTIDTQPGSALVQYERQDD